MELQDLQYGFRRYRKWERGEFVVVFVDTAGGGGDFVAAQFMSYQRLDVPLVYHSLESITTATPILRDELERIYTETGIRPLVAYERNNGGAYEMERLERLNRHDHYEIYTEKVLDKEGKLVDSGKPGFTTTGSANGSGTRPKMLQELQEALNFHLIIVYDRPTVNEMFSFVVKKTPGGWRAEAEEGAHDDLIMSLAGVYQLYQYAEPPSRFEQEQARPPQEDNLFDEEGFYA